MKFLSFHPFFYYVFIVVIAIVIAVNLVSHELIIPMSKNGYVHNIFEIKLPSSNSPVLKGRLIFIYPYF